jgi:hypothetical protein
MNADGDEKSSARARPGVGPMIYPLSVFPLREVNRTADPRWERTVSFAPKSVAPRSRCRSQKQTIIYLGRVRPRAASCWERCPARVGNQKLGEQAGLGLLTKSLSTNWQNFFQLTREVSVILDASLTIAVRRLPGATVRLQP